MVVAHSMIGTLASLTGLEADTGEYVVLLPAGMFPSFKEMVPEFIGEGRRLLNVNPSLWLICQVYSIRVAGGWADAQEVPTRTCVHKARIYAVYREGSSSQTAGGAFSDRELGSVVCARIP